MRKDLALWLLGCLLCAAVPVQAGVDAFLRLDGVPGESTAVGFVDEIVIDAFAMAVSNPGAQPVFTDLSLTKAQDKASPLLMLKCAQGDLIPTAVLTCRTLSGAKPVPFYVIRLTNVKVTQVSLSGSAAASAKPTESFSLNYEQIEWEYTPINANGSTGNPIKTKWNLLTGAP